MNKHLPFKTITTAAAILFSSITVLLGIGIAIGNRPFTSAISAPPPVPWQCIGGCGAGGSGSGAASGIRWIGSGVKGYLLSVECLPELSLGNDNGGLHIAPRIAFHPNWHTEIGVTLPVDYNVGEVSYQSNLSEETHVNGGPGDIAAYARYAFGNEGAFALTATCVFPTGEWDAGRGPEQSRRILPRELQPGKGVYGATLRLDAERTFDEDMLQVGGSLHYPFNVRFDRRNVYLDGDYRAYATATANSERFYYRHIVKPYGESDRGDYYPPSLKLDAAYGMRRDRTVTHSLQLSFEAMLGTTWVRNFDPRRYDPYPDPDHHAWIALLAYGVEFSKLRFPLFAGVGLPISDRRGPDNRWDGIDGDRLFREWLFVGGFTTGIF